MVTIAHQTGRASLPANSAYLTCLGFHLRNQRDKRYSLTARLALKTELYRIPEHPEAC